MADHHRGDGSAAALGNVPYYPVQHPLPVGSLVLSLHGVYDTLLDDDGNDGVCLDGENHSGPMAVGVIRSAEFFGGTQGWAYHTTFPSVTPRPPGSSEPQPVWVVLDQGDSIDDPEMFRVLVLGEE